MPMRRSGADTGEPMESHGIPWDPVGFRVLAPVLFIGRLLLDLMRAREIGGAILAFSTSKLIRMVLSPAVL